MIIVGAGISGAAAAHELTQHGFEVIVVEARNRIGGRICTDRHSLSGPIDLGAGWIHEAVGNPITELCKRFHVETKKTDYDNNQLYRTDGEEASDKEEDNADKLYEKVLKKAHHLRDTLGGHDISLGEAIERVVHEMGLDAKQQLYLQYSIHTSLEHEYGGDVSTMSLLTYDEGEEFDGDDLMVMGYDGVVTGLLATPGIVVALEHIVMDIKHEDVGGVLVATNRGTLAADYVVVTLPLGVLQHGSVRFNPPLLEKKITAMSHLQMGQLNKVFLEFPKVFWEKDIEVLNYVSRVKGHWQESYNLHYYTKKPILLMFASGNFSLEMERMTDDQIVASAMYVLREIHDNVPNPTKHVITRWASDPFRYRRPNMQLIVTLPLDVAYFTWINSNSKSKTNHVQNNPSCSYGSYSYSRVGASQPRDRKAMAERQGRTLFFAGEATSVLYPATAHGVRLTLHAQNPFSIVVYFYFFHPNVHPIFQLNCVVGLPLWHRLCQKSDIRQWRWE